MIQALKNILGIGNKVKLGDLIAGGAKIIDVRTRGEYSSGHAKGSVNVPLDELSAYLKKLKKEEQIITCCASGMRSASAKSFLMKHGFKNVYNAGPWITLKKYTK